MKNNKQDYEEDYTDEQLRGLHTKQLIQLKNGINALKTSADTTYFYYQHKAKECAYVCNKHEDYLSRIRTILSTREHIPNKQEAKELRKKKLFQNRNK